MAEAEAVFLLLVQVVVPVTAERLVREEVTVLLLPEPSHSAQE